ncbi:pentapeptide repeat-containing protein [Egbenema bharatensis]|uniref:pentapeptide repeat-containing protein n=1 Tax=Egbenema bharatensis TaxID=3463334 RepID=UPI003A86D82A
MKNTRKEEVVWLYELGERNFKRQNLRGKCFRGEDLSEADFSGSDIRGADFSHAILTGANFTNVTAGLMRRQAITLLIILLVAATLLGLIAGAIGALAEAQFLPVNASESATFNWVTPVIIIAFTFVSLTRSMAAGFSIFVGAFALATLGALISSEAIPIAGSIAAVIAVNAAVAAATAAVSSLMAAAVLSFRITIGLAVAAFFVIGFSLAITLTKALVPASSIASAITVASIVLPLSGYIGWRTIKGDRKNTITAIVAHFLATKWGTNFRGADLTQVDFSRAVLKSTDFSRANLTNTRWERNVWDGNSLD